VDTSLSKIQAFFEAYARAAFREVLTLDITWQIPGLSIVQDGQRS
jgi:hypothetical protein